MLIKAPKGTKDVIPEESYKWQYLENFIREVCNNFGYNEIRTPVFEHTELFERGVGDTTDVVQKEMYTFNDKGSRSITLRPEGTASIVRSYVENSLYSSPQPSKLYYLYSCYRYEKPQKGRLREFHQFGVEVFGADSYSIDAEIISLAMCLLKKIGLKKLKLNINSIGCPKCRKRFHEALREYLKGYMDELCDTCKTRFEKNPLRIIDCKSSHCKKIVANAPVVLDYLCDDCKKHFEGLKQYLTDMGIEYNVDSKIVRGLDYYTRTVFEIISEDIGSQSAVCGGGRYDGLSEELGGPAVSGIGFAMGLERILLVLEEQGIQIPKPSPIKIFISSIGENANIKAQSIVLKLRENGISADSDHMNRSLKAQMRYANKMGAKYTMVLGDNEINSGKANLKDMQTGEVKEIEIKNIIDVLKQL